MYDEPEVIARSAQELVGDLNPQQAEAVQYRGQALLIGAGAGSGKTRVLTRRIAWILSQFGAWPSQILAITFTNKAALAGREVGRVNGEVFLPTGQIVLEVGDMAENRAWSVALDVEVEFGGDDFDESLGVGGIVDGEAGLESDGLAVAPQNARKTRLADRPGGPAHVGLHLPLRLRAHSEARRQVFRAFRRRPCW